MKKDIEIIGYTAIFYGNDDLMKPVYDEIVKKYNLTKANDMPFLASLFYSLGCIHGKRMERARKC